MRLGNRAQVANFAAGAGTHLNHREVGIRHPSASRVKGHAYMVVEGCPASGTAPSRADRRIEAVSSFTAVFPVLPVTGNHCDRQRSRDCSCGRSAPVPQWCLQRPTGAVAADLSSLGDHQPRWLTAAASGQDSYGHPERSPTRATKRSPCAVNSAAINEITSRLLIRG